MTATVAPDADAVAARLRAAGCVFAEDEARMLLSAARTPAELTAMMDRRVAGLPLEHVLGWAEFCGLRMAVDPGVFVPRRRTEFLVHRAAALAGQGAVVVDLCCGCGAVGAALAAAVGGAELYAVDLDPVAVLCARRNLAAVGGEVFEGDLYAPLPAALRGRVDLLVANAPYVPTAAIGLMPPEARLHEPLLALDGGADGLDVQRRVIAAASAWLAPGGHLLVETSERQAARTAEIVAGSGLVPLVARSEELDATIVVAAPCAVTCGNTENACGVATPRPDERPRDLARAVITIQHMHVVPSPAPADLPVGTVPDAVRIAMVCEALPADPRDYFFSSVDSMYVTNVLDAFRDAGIDVHSIGEVQARGVHLTVAVKAPKLGTTLPAATIAEHAAFLDAELALFPHLDVIMAMGDVAIAAVNQVARRRGGARVIPAGSTYRIRHGVYTMHGVRVLPSYLPTGRSFLIERSKREMVAEDIRLAFAVVGAADRP